MINNHKSTHVYSFFLGTLPDYDEFIVEIWVDTDPTRAKRVVQRVDGGTTEYGNSELVATLQMEEGRDKVKIELGEQDKEVSLYLDEFIEALQHAKELLLK